MVKRYLLAGIGVVFLGMSSVLYGADAEITLEDSTSNSGFSVKNSNGSTLMRTQGDGNVGIGNAAPSAKLHIGGAALQLAAIFNGSQNDGLALSMNASSARMVLEGGVEATFYLVDRGAAANQKAMVLIADNGITRFASVTDNGALILTDNILAMNQSSGNVGIGTPTPRDRLDVAGAVHATSFPTDSDIRFKKNIKSLNGALDKVQNLRGVSYDWRTDEFKQRGFSDKRTIGIIAQEVEEVVPEIVHTASDGYKSVEYSKLVPLLIEAIKEQQDEIKQLKQAIGL